MSLGLWVWDVSNLLVVFSSATLHMVIRVYVTYRSGQTGGVRYQYTGPVWPETGPNWSKSNLNLKSSVQTVRTGIPAGLPAGLTGLPVGLTGNPPNSIFFPFLV